MDSCARHGFALINLRVTPAYGSTYCGLDLLTTTSHGGNCGRNFYSPSEGQSAEIHGGALGVPDIMLESNKLSFLA